MRDRTDADYVLSATKAGRLVDVPRRVMTRIVVAGVCCARLLGGLDIADAAALNGRNHVTMRVLERIVARGMRGTFNGAFIICLGALCRAGALVAMPGRGRRWRREHDKRKQRYAEQRRKRTADGEREHAADKTSPSGSRTPQRHDRCRRVRRLAACGGEGTSEGGRAPGVGAAPEERPRSA